MKIIILVLGFILMFSFVNALTIDQGVVLNTSNSNSSLNFSFAINISNFTIESNYILLYGINFTNDTGVYTCDNINYSANNSILDSSQFNCTQQVLQSPSTGGSPSSNYFIKEKESSQSLMAHIKIASGKTASIDFANDRGTAVKSLTIKARKYLNGDLKISEIHKKPDDCTIPLSDNYKIYKIIEINHTFDNNLIEGVEMDILVDKSWVQWNNISKINTYRCDTTTELLKTELLELKESKYRIHSNGFSVWAIIGLKKKTQEASTIEENITEELPAEKIETPIITGRVINGEGEGTSWIIIAVATTITILLVVILIIGRKKKRK